MRTVMSFGLQKKLADAFKRRLKFTETWTIAKGFKRGIFNGLVVYFQDISFAVFILTSVYFRQLNADSFTPRMVIQAFLSMVFVSDALTAILGFVRDVDVAKEAATHIFEIIETKMPDGKRRQKNARIYNLKGEITFENVSFTYPEVPSVRKISDASTSKVARSVFKEVKKTRMLSRGDQISFGEKNFFLFHIEYW